VAATLKTTGPDSVVAADFDGDGAVDLVIGVSSTQSLLVFAGRGDGSFALRGQYRVGDFPISGAVADYNGDGKLDLAFANINDNMVSILAGRSDGTFDPPVHYGAGKGAAAIVAGDFDGDGRIDLATTTFWFDGVAVLMNMCTAPPAVPDLVVAKSHAGNFRRGQRGATYAVTVTNSASAATAGSVTAVDTLPAGLVATAIGGTGWSCDLGAMRCTRSDSLTGGSSYPPIVVTVDVAENAPDTLINQVTVSGGGQTNPSNDSASDPTVIDAATMVPAIRALSPETVCQGSPAFDLAIDGSGFVKGAIAQINGSARTTTFVSSEQLTAAVPASDTTTPRELSVRVGNPDGSVSDPRPLVVASDTMPPTVTAPPAATIMQSMCPAPGAGGATAATSPQLGAFLAGASAADNCSGPPSKLVSQMDGNDITDTTVFRAGSSNVTFRFRDNAGNVGAASSTVTVRLYADLNLDKAVDAVDFVLLANELVGNVTAGLEPAPAPAMSADLNRDSAVDAVDFVIQANYLAGNVTCVPVR
jgi:uncharacterized repeat protein (TIGR01451 family)